MKDNLLILVNSRSPLSTSIKNSQYQFIVTEYFELKDFTKYNKQFKNTNILLDLTYAQKFEQKENLLTQCLEINSQLKIFSDTTSICPLSLIDYFPQIFGTFSANFFSPKQTFEYWRKEKNPEIDLIIQKFFINCFQLTPHYIKHINIGGNYPRVISMIINEAYIALEDDLSTKNDIDKAMINGLNYPIGPFKWADQIGQDILLDLLNNLFQVTHESRYKTSTILRSEARKLCLKNQRHLSLMQKEHQ